MIILLCGYGEYPNHADSAFVGELICNYLQKLLIFFFSGDLDLLSSPHGRVRRSVEFSHPLRRSSTGSYSYFRSPSTR